MQLDRGIEIERLVCFLFGISGYIYPHIFLAIFSEVFSMLTSINIIKLFSYKMLLNIDFLR